MSLAFRPLIPLLLVLLLPLAVHASDTFEKIGVFAYGWTRFSPDARSQAMGGTGVASAEGAGGFWWNPAVGSSARSGEFLYSHGDYPGEANGYSVLALAAEWRRLRFGLAQSRWRLSAEMRDIVDPSDVWTEKWTETMSLAGISVDLSPWFGAWDSALRLSAGASYRHYGGELVSDSSADAWDLGLHGMRRWHAGGDGWLGARAGIMFRNLFDAKVSLGDLAAPLGQDLRLGFAFEGGIGPRRRGANLVELLVAFMANRDMDTSRGDHESYGAEMRLLGLLALRAGDDGQPLAEADSATWGIGLILEEPELLPVGLTLDYARADAGSLGDKLERFQVGLHLLR